MAPKERLTAGCIFFGYKARPDISTEGCITGSTKDVVSMEWLNADDLVVKVDRGPDAPNSTVLAPFVAISLHESHIIGLPLIKVPYTMMFNKTCERAERVDRTYLAITPSENTVRLRSKRFDSRFRPYDGTNFPTQKIYKDPNTGRPMPEWDTFIDLAMPMIIHLNKIEWHAEIFKAPVSEVVRLIRLYRFVQGLDVDIPDPEDLDRDGEPLDLDDRDRTQRRPIELIGPGVRRERKEPTPPLSAERIGNPAPEATQIPRQKNINTVTQTKTSQTPNYPTQNTWATAVTSGKGQYAAAQPVTKPAQAPAQQPAKATDQANAQQNRNHPEQGDYRGGPKGNNPGGQGGYRGGGGGRGNYNGNRGKQQQHGGNSGNFGNGQGRGGQKHGRGGKYQNGQTRNQQGGAGNQQKGQVENKGIEQKAEPEMPNSGHLAGLMKDTKIQAKKIPDIETEVAAPVAEILELAQAILLSVKTTVQDKNKNFSADNKNQYNFAAYVRDREHTRVAKLDRLAEEKDSAELVTDDERTTWNKPESQLVKDPWPEDWKILKAGEEMIEGIKNVPTREGWEYQKPNTPWWTRVQNWLELYGEDRKFKGWEYPDAIEY
ncbi:hypothetical protein ABW20_dc0100155 [Dactylellina cionopaga]|nr:hypothetical protein ABW20_dc0100155 [Dactylellina cionopaga]